MPFKPINPRNAIVEASVFVHLNRPVSQIESDAVRALHPQFRLDLPRLDEVPSIQIGIGPLPPLARPVTMAAYMRDGSLETSLRLYDKMLVIRFRAYTSWAELWPKAETWMRKTLDAISAATPQENVPPLAVFALRHQIIDVFLWEGDSAAMTLREIFREPSKRLPEDVWNAVGQQWFAAHSTNTPDTTTNRALIDFLALDLSEETRIDLRLKLDHNLEVRFREPIPPGECFKNVDAKSMAGDTISGLHERNRELMRALLKPDMLSRIGMSS